MRDRSAEYSCLALDRYARCNSVRRTDPKKISVPTLVLHGDDDQIVPVKASAELAVKLLKNGTLKVYPGYPHGMLATNPDVLNADMLAFIRS